MELREYQKDIVNKVFEKEDNILIVLPTGGGKTVIAKEIISKVKEQVLFIVPKLELIKQASDIFNENVDVIWSFQTKVEGNHITVASKQTLMHRKLSKYFNKPITVIVDEVHIGLQTLKKCLQDVEIKRIIGLTATPERSDGSSFIIKEYCKHIENDESIYKYGVFHRIINDWNICELQKLGYLSPLHVELNPDAECLAKIKPKHKYDDELDSDVIISAMGDNFYKFINKAKKFKGKPTLIFTPDLQSLNVVLKTLNKSGLKYKGVDGSMPVKEREEILHKLEKNKIDGVVNCGVLTTGFDMPKIKQCIIIRNIKSKMLLFQIVGRFIRPYNGETAEVYDFGGSCYNFATASVPNIFEHPVDWRYEGFLRDFDFNGECEIEKTEDLKECLDDVNITWTEYLKDPVTTLLNSLLKYKEDFEINIFNTSDRLKNIFDNKVNYEVNKKVGEIEEKVKEDIILNQETLIQNEIQKRAYAITVNPLKEWFHENGFEWFRLNYPPILTAYNYDDCEIYKQMRSEYIYMMNNSVDTDFVENFNKKYGDFLDKLDKIEIDTIQSLPFENLLENIQKDPDLEKVFDELYDARTTWWLSNFKLKYTEKNVKSEADIIIDEMKLKFSRGNTHSLASKALGIKTSNEKNS